MSVKLRFLALATLLIPLGSALQCYTCYGTGCVNNPTPESCPPGARNCYALATSQIDPTPSRMGCASSCTAIIGSFGNKALCSSCGTDLCNGAILQGKGVNTAGIGGGAGVNRGIGGGGYGNTGIGQGTGYGNSNRGGIGTGARVGNNQNSGGYDPYGNQNNKPYDPYSNNQNKPYDPYNTNNQNNKPYDPYGNNNQNKPYDPYDPNRNQNSNSGGIGTGAEPKWARGNSNDYYENWSKADKFAPSFVLLLITAVFLNFFL